MKVFASIDSLFAVAILALSVTLTSASPSGADLTLAAEANPDPAEPGQMLDVQISVSTTSSTDTLTLRVLWPAELNITPVVTAGGDCPGGGCEAGEYLTWDLGTLDPNTSVTVSFDETVRGNIVDGTLIALEIELLENATEEDTLDLSIEVQTDSPLEIAIDPRLDPVASGGTLIYELVYGNTSTFSSQSTELEMPIPTGTQFVSATGGGVHAGGKVSWDIGSFAPSVGGREWVTVQVDAVSDGTLLVVDAVILSGTISTVAKESRAMAVSRVATEPLALAMETNPDRVEPFQVLDSQITVSNTTSSATGVLTLRVLWAEELSNTPVASPGGDCPGGGCEAGEYLSWPLGVLQPADSTTANFDEINRGITVDGTLIPLEVELIEGNLPARNVSHTVITQTVSPLELAIEPSPDPVASNGTLVYELVYGNAGATSSENTQLIMPVPAGTQFVSATGGGAFAAGRVSWDLDRLAATGGGRERVTVQVDALADGTLLMVDAATLSGEVNFQARQARAMAVGRVAPEPLELELDVTPNPVSAREDLKAEITVTNPRVDASGALTLRLIWPRELSNTPVATGGGDCPGGGCERGEFMTWNLGVLVAGGDITVSVEEIVRANMVEGMLIPLEFELIEDGFPARNAGKTALIHPFVDTDNDGEANVFDGDDDDDGMPDWWEELHGLEPLNPSDADDDPDMDGLTNLEEFLLETDPHVSDLIFADGFESGDTSAW